MPNKQKGTTLDSVLVQIGDFGKYQAFNLVLVSVVLLVHSAVHVIFVFSAIDLGYRCKVPICDGNITSYNEDWLQYAMPLNSDGNPSKCERYHVINPEGECNGSNFNRDLVERCDDFVYKKKEVTIINDYDLQCDDNLWKVTLVGTINNVGQFVGLPIYGIISDRYGRKSVLIMGMFLCGLLGVIQSFAPDYLTFIILEFLGAAFGAGTYTCAFIIGVELVGPAKRVLTGTIISEIYPFGEVLTAGVAWAFKAFRPTILALYAPGLIFPVLFCLIPESVRWLLTEGKTDEAKMILKRAAKINGKSLSDDTLTALANCEENDVEKIPIRKMFKSTTLLIRCINCCIAWITCALLFYGLSLNSVALSEDIYLNFILTALIEIPAYLSVFLILKKIGRRTTLCCSFLLSAASCFALIFVSKEQPTTLICVNLVGKFAATIAFQVCYVITSEVFPTSLRHSLMGTCSMFGRIGSMLAPQIPLLVQAWTPLPMVLFGATATTAGLLSLHFPETFNVKLPDTIEEAENIGRSTDSLPRK